MAGCARVPSPDADRPFDVLDLHLAAVLEAHVDTVADALVDDGGNADAARLGQWLQARRNIDAIAVDVVAVDDDVAKVDADPQRDARTVRLHLAMHRSLNCQGTADGIDDAGKLDQGAVAHELDDAATVGSDGGIEDDFTVSLQSGQRAGLVGAHHARIADDICRQDGRQPACRASVGHQRLVLDIRCQRQWAVGAPATKNGRSRPLRAALSFHCCRRHRLSPPRAIGTIALAAMDSATPSP